MLASEVLTRFNKLRLRVHGLSMLPAILPGDMLDIVPCASTQAAPGDVVLFRRDDRFVIHRVLAHTASGLLTQGDANRAPDLPVDSADVLGRVVGVTRHGRAIAHRHALHPGAGLARWLFRRSHFAARVFVRLQRRRTGHRA